MEEQENVFAPGRQIPRLGMAEPRGLSYADNGLMRIKDQLRRASGSKGMQRSGVQGKSFLWKPGLGKGVPPFLSFKLS